MLLAFEAARQRAWRTDVSAETRTTTPPQGAGSAREPRAPLARADALVPVAAAPVELLVYVDEAALRADPRDADPVDARATLDDGSASRATPVVHVVEDDAGNVRPLGRRTRRISTSLRRDPGVRAEVAMRTRVSGDVHVGSRGQIVSKRPEHLLDGESAPVIHQVTSSAIVYPPPSTLALAGMRVVASEEPSQLLAVTRVSTELVPVAAGQLLLGRNNWLSIEPDLGWPSSKQRLWIRWITADGDVKPPLVIGTRRVASASLRRLRRIRPHCVAFVN